MHEEPTRKRSGGHQLDCGERRLLPEETTRLDVSENKSGALPHMRGKQQAEACLHKLGAGAVLHSCNSLYPEFYPQLPAWVTARPATHGGREERRRSYYLMNPEFM